MSEPIPESIPTSISFQSRRPAKKRALTPVSQQASAIDALFADPSREIHVPESSTDKPKQLAPPPEIVANVQGSSAGAGSGEFHVYKTSRRREYERLRLMDEEVRREEDGKEATRVREEWEKKDREKTEKNRAKREKQKARKAKGKKGAGGDNGKPAAEAEEVKKKVIPKVHVTKVDDDDSGEKDDGREESVGGAVKNSEEIGLIIEDDD